MFQIQKSGRPRLPYYFLMLAAMSYPSLANSQTNNYFGTTGSIAGVSWSTNPAGPYNSALNTTGGAIINFNNAATFFGGNIVVAGISASANATLDNPVGTISNFGDAVIGVNVDSGKTLDFALQSFTNSATAGYIKNGGGIVALAGGSYGGGFTLNNGTVIVRGANALGFGGSLTLNGGILAGDSTWDLSGRYAGGITVGGNVQLGDLTGLAAGSANLTFDNNLSLGNATRTLTLGNNGIQTFSGIISNTSGGLTFAANVNTTGRFDISNASNSFTGPIEVNGGEVRFAGNGSLGNAANSIIIDGGRFSANSSYSIASTHGVAVGDGGGTVINTEPAVTLTYDGVIANKTSEVGSWAKQGTGTVSLGGVSTYSGNTAINNGTIRLTTGNDRLPTGTVVSLGQAASTNLGTLDLNGRSQQIAGLNSISGNNATATNNTVTSATGATLTIGGSGSYSFGTNTNANSGVITGAISLNKTGAGTQTLGDVNTYTGGTTVSGGMLVLGNATNTLADAGAVNVNGGTLSIGNNSDTVGAVTLTSGSITGSSGVLTGSSYAVESGSVSAILGGSSGLTKSTAGTVTLSGANTYTGATLVNSGKLIIASGGSIGSSGAGITVTGGEFNVTGTGTATANSVMVSGSGFVSGTGTVVSSNVTVATGGKLAPGNSIGTLKINGNLALAGTYDWEVVLGTNQADIAVVAGALNLTGAFLNLIDTGTYMFGDKFTLMAYSGTLTGVFTNSITGWSVNYNDTVGQNGDGGATGFKFITLSAIPEPTTVAMFGLCLFCMGAGRRRRQVV